MINVLNGNNWQLMQFQPEVSITNHTWSSISNLHLEDSVFQMSILFSVPFIWFHLNFCLQMTLNT